MGRRHSEILRSFGDEVDGVDLGWDPEKTDFKQYNSVIIATPPKTHLNAILWVDRKTLGATPVFVEKPLTSEIWKPQEYTCSISQVACNWRWCFCADMSSGSIEMGYPANQETAYLDMIHFLDLFWVSWGRPEFGGFTTSKGKITLTVSGSGRVLEVVFNPNSTTRYTKKDGKSVHKKGVCSMFERQMRDWRHSVYCNLQTANPIQVAAERHNWLVQKWASR